MMIKYEIEKNGNAAIYYILGGRGGAHLKNKFIYLFNGSVCFLISMMPSTLQTGAQTAVSDLLMSSLENGDISPPSMLKDRTQNEQKKINKKQKIKNGGIITLVTVIIIAIFEISLYFLHLSNQTENKNAHTNIKLTCYDSPNDFAHKLVKLSMGFSPPSSLKLTQNMSTPAAEVLCSISSSGDSF